MHRLSDQRLFRQHCYIDGRWVDADTGAVMGVAVMAAIPEKATATLHNWATMSFSRSNWASMLVLLQFRV